MSQKEIEAYQQNLPERELFLRHQKLIEELVVDDRSSLEKNPASNFQIQDQASSFKSPASNNPYVAFYLPRLNNFLGKFMHYGGLYPDGSIRLIKKSKARFPCRDVHEVMEVDGSAGWLQNPLLHYDSPTFKRYIERNNRYINLMVKEMKEKNSPKNIATLLHWCIVKPVGWFFMTQIFNKGILDGWRGVVFSFFSAMRFPRAYIRYLQSK